jgi:hypothetical protein
MSPLLRVTLAAALATTLAACGGAKLGGGKEGAAEALRNIGAGGSPSSKSGLAALAAQAAGTTLTLEQDCLESGSVKIAVTASADGGSGSALATFTSQFLRCNHDGRNTYDGSLAVSLSAEVRESEAYVAFHYKGKVDISGDISDFVDADVTMAVRATEQSATRGELTIITNGTIRTSTATHTYDNETLRISAGGELRKGDS